MTIVISVENLSKSYRLGQIGTGTFTNDLKLWWAKARHKPNPFLRIGDSGHHNHDGEDLWALRDVSFTVQMGEVLGIIGKNGAGKSTLLKILSRVTAPTSGRIKVKGRIASLLEVGTGFHPELTGRENVYLNGAILGMSRHEIDRRFDEIVDFAEVEKFIDTPVKRYSSGMYVRLAFAVAAHLEPEILVVDEVLAVGDAEFQKKCLGKMGDVAREGRTVLFVSHNMRAIRKLCTRVIMFSYGMTEFDGDTQDAINKYLTFGPNLLVNVFDPKPESPVRISKIEIRNALGSLANKDIETRNGFKIRIYYRINSSIKGIHAFIRINLADGETLLSTGDSDLSPQMLGRRSVGDYVCEIGVPPGLLAPGSYSVTWSAGIPFQTNYDVEFDALSFQVSDNFSARGEFIHFPRPGLISLDIPWNYLSNHEIN